jgi:hypothetical protein
MGQVASALTHAKSDSLRGVFANFFGNTKGWKKNKICIAIMYE